MELGEKLRQFFNELRSSGISVGISQEEDCLRALSAVDWSHETFFYAAVSSTLVKDSVLLPLFNEIYARYFHPFSVAPFLPVREVYGSAGAEPSPEANFEGTVQSGLGTRQAQSEGVLKRSGDCAQKAGEGKKNPLRLEFNEPAHLLTPEDLLTMEMLIPVLAKKMASKMIIKKRRNQAGRLDFRKTLRQSMGSGGVPVELYVKKKHKERPMIFALCDVSLSCLNYSHFSLAMVYSLEKFFRQVRSFAFVESTDEITDIVKLEPYSRLRAQTLSQARVYGHTGYTNYGDSLASFYERFGNELTHKSSVLVFGDARTNWFDTRSDILQEIQRRVKRIYWFNPEPVEYWETGDSAMLSYQKYCSRAFECANLEQLAGAICNME